MRPGKFHAAVLFTVALIASALAGIVGAPPASACLRGSCGWGDMFLEFKPGPYEYGRPLNVRAKIYDLSGSCAILQYCDAATGSVVMYRDGVSGIIAQGTLHATYPECMYEQCGESETYELRTAVLGPGTFDVRANYVPSGENQFDVTDVRETVTIEPAPVRFSAYDSPDPSELGEPVTFTAEVEPRDPDKIDLAAGAHLPGGYVVFSVDQQPRFSAVINAEGVAKVTTTDLPAGTHEWSAEYHPDPDYRPPSYVVTSTHTVTTPVPSPPDLALAQSENTSVFGQPVTLTATASAPSGRTVLPTGQVDFLDGGTTIGSAALSGTHPDTAAVESSALPVGSHALRAHYRGDGGSYLATDSAAINHTVTKAGTETTLMSSGVDPSSLGAPVTLHAHVAVSAPGAGTPTGTVQFKDGAAALGAPIAVPPSGDVDMTTTTLAGGAHTITATYSGDGNLNPSTSAPLTRTVRCTTMVTGTIGGNYTVPATGTTCFSNAHIGGKVTIPAGAKVSFVSTSIGGSLTGGGGTMVFCGSSVGGAVSIQGAGPLTIGDPDNGCAANAFDGAVQLTATTGGVGFIGNRVRGSLTVNGTSGGPTIIGANTIGGGLACTGNNPAAINGGRPNTAGTRTGECAASGF